MNPHSLICARLVSPRVGVSLDRRRLAERLHEAQRLRRRIYPRPYYRLAYGESDRLPGLVVDRYGEIAVAQIGTAGMEGLRSDIAAVLADLDGVACVVMRNDGHGRELEGLPRYVEVEHGTLPERVIVEENGARFVADLVAGQKTGWYFDHRDNRARLARWVGGASVLDLFSYAGAWGVQAAIAGASRVVCVDSSARALEAARENAELNGVAATVETLEADAFDALKALREAGERFDVVILDPPAFVRRRRDAKRGIEAYHRVNRLAVDVLAADGILVSASCSSPLGADQLASIVHGAARHGARRCQIVERGHQAADHPVHPAMPESEYLKVVFARLY